MSDSEFDDKDLRAGDLNQSCLPPQKKVRRRISKEGLIVLV